LVRIVLNIAIGQKFKIWRAVWLCSCSLSSGNGPLKWLTKECSMKLRLMLGRNLWSLAAFLIALGFSLPALAATYSFASGSNPPCSGTWSVSGSVYSCSGKLTLATGDSILPTSGITIKATSGIVFAGNNTVGSSTATVDLENNYGGIQISGTSTIFGGLKIPAGPSL